MNRLFILFFIIVLYENSFGNEFRQEGAVIKNCNSKYMTKCFAITRRTKRGEPYRTNMTGTTLLPFYNNVTLQISYGIKGYPDMMSMKMKVCDTLGITWLREYASKYSNIPIACPVVPGSYGVFNMEFPPKNLPLPVPKGLLYFTMNLQITDTKELIVKVDLILHVT